MGRSYYIRPGQPVLPTVAEAWVSAADADGRAVQDGRIIVPTRRAARSLASAFLEASHRRALLLPQITPLSDLDEVSLFFTDGLRLLPAMRDTRRLSLLAALITAQPSPSGRPVSGAAAWALARDLARMVDETTREGVTLEGRLSDLVGGNLAAHWLNTVQFLDIITKHLPRIMRQQKALSAEERRVALMQAQVASWDTAGSSETVWLAGVGYASRALADFAAGVLRQRRGAVILAGYDPDTSENDWDAAISGVPHPSCGARLLMDRLGITRGDVELLESTIPARGCPVAATRMFGPIAAAAREGLPDSDRIEIIQARDEHEEDRAIAMAIRDELDTPGRTVAFVTPSREQATRVSAHLREYGIHAEDSAGDPVLATPPGVFLRAIADTVEKGFDPVALLAVLKNPFAGFAGDSANTRRLARRLETRVIRALHPASGLDALEAATDETADADLRAFVGNIRHAMEPLSSLPPEQRCALPDLLRALVAVADRITGDDGNNLWSGEAGAALSAALVTLSSDVDTLVPVAPGELAAFMAEALADVSVRRPRNKDAHARVAIWGVLEARLQHVDTMIVGGLCEGVFPAQPDPGPWLSRPMRRDIGMPDLDLKIAEQAHDFQCLLGSAHRIILAAPARAAGAPAVPSRFLSRLLAAAGTLKSHPAPSWVRQTNLPGERIQRPAPAPVPPIETRPRRYTISDVGLLMTDPYALYSKRILRIRPIDSLAVTSDASLFGEVVHNGYMKFLNTGGNFAHEEASAHLFQAFLSAIPAGRPSAGAQAWWRARLQRVAVWAVQNERERAANRGVPRVIALEVSGTWPLGEDGLVIEGRADRLEVGADGLASVIDYKTGTVPSPTRVADGSSPQLPIEAAMVRVGAFGPDLKAEIGEMAYWKLSGGTISGKTMPIHADRPERLIELVDAAEDSVPALLRHYALAETPFLDTPHPWRQPAARPYDGISRRTEWDIT